MVAGLAVREPAAIDFQVLMYPPVDRRADLSGPDGQRGART